MVGISRSGGFFFCACQSVHQGTVVFGDGKFSMEEIGRTRSGNAKIAVVAGVTRC